MRVTVDLDGTICETKGPNQTYAEVSPLPGAIESLKDFKSRGYYIIIHTARNMATYNNNLGAIIKNQAGIVTDWLKKYEIPYDELLFGKPNVDVVIDDKALRYRSWEQVRKDILEIEKQLYPNKLNNPDFEKESY
jgi:capsule biosynthesis phosphatase